MNPQNQVGHVNGSASPANDLAEIHVGHYCASKDNADPAPVCLGEHRQDLGRHARQRHLARPLTIPTLTCCSPRDRPGRRRRTARRTRPRPPTPSYMGFWYLNAGLGPKSPCASFSGTPPKFDTASGADNTINESAYSRGGPFDLTGAAYSCTSADGQTKLAWDGTTLTIKGNVFIDGSARSGSAKREVRRQGDDHPQRALLDGQPGHALREPRRAAAAARVRRGIRTPPPSRSWRPGSTRRPGHSRVTASKSRKGTSRDCSSPPGTSSGASRAPLVLGPMVSVYGSVDAGQSGTLQFPPITFASSGTDGLTGPLPLPRLLPPIQFGGG